MFIVAKRMPGAKSVLGSDPTSVDPGTELLATRQDKKAITGTIAVAQQALTPPQASSAPAESLAGRVTIGDIPRSNYIIDVQEAVAHFLAKLRDTSASKKRKLQDLESGYLANASQLADKSRENAWTGLKTAAASLGISLLPHILSVLYAPASQLDIDIASAVAQKITPAFGDLSKSAVEALMRRIEAEGALLLQEIQRDGQETGDTRRQEMISILEKILDALRSAARPN